MAYMSPEEKIHAGLHDVGQAIGDLRADYEEAARQQERRREAIVGAESSLRGLAALAAAARRPRHLQPRELAGPRRPPADRVSEPAVPVDDVTQRSLELYGLARPAEVRGSAEGVVVARVLLGVA